MTHDDYQRALEAKQSQELGMLKNLDELRQIRTELGGLLSLGAPPSDEAQFTNSLGDALGTVRNIDQHLAQYQALEPSLYDEQLASGRDPFGVADPTTGLANFPGSPSFNLAIPLADPDMSSPSSGIPGWVQALNGIGGALEAFGAGFHGRTPLFMQQQQLGMQQQQLNQQFANQRALRAQQMQQLEEQKRQHNWQVAEKLISTGNIEALDQFGEQFPPAKLIAQAVSKQDLAELPAFVERGYIPQEFVQRVMNPKPGEKMPSAGELRSYVDMGKQMFKEDVKAEAKQRQLEQAMNTPAEKRRPSQQLLVDEHQAKLDVQAADVELKKANAAKATMEAQRGPIDHSEMNKTHESMFGKPWAQGTPETQSKARDATWRGRTQAHTDVTSDTPVGQLGKAQEYRDPVSGQAAPAWATQRQLQQMGYVNIEPTQVQTVTQLSNVDAAMKEILGAGSALVRKETGSTLFDIPMGFLQTPIINLMKKYAGDPDAALLQSALSRIAPSMAKLAGDTGNIAVAEQQIYKDAVFSAGDTLESFTNKVKSIMEAQKRTRAAMGFVDNDKSYIRRLAIQGKSDDQIKAIMEERQRMR